MVYLDQQVLIQIGRGRADADSELLTRLRNGQTTLILSPAHWVEIARGDSEANSVRLAQFVSELEPWWLRERIDLHQLEIRCLMDETPEAIRREWAFHHSLPEAANAIGGNPFGPVQHVTLEELVLALRNNDQARQRFETAYRENERASVENRRRHRDGWFTPARETALQREYLRRVGGVQAYSEKDALLADVEEGDIPSIVTEWEATKLYWARGGSMHRRRFHDMQHMSVALPYVNAIVSEDQELRIIAGEVQNTVQFPCAEVFASTQELLDFLDEN